MIKHPLRNLTAASILAGATHGAIAQTPMPQTPTTKILAVGTFAPGTDMSQVQRILPTEVRETAQLYLDMAASVLGGGGDSALPEGVGAGVVGWSSGQAAKVELPHYNRSRERTR